MATDTMIGSRVSFIGINGPVSGVVISLWEYHGKTYVLTRDSEGCYHGYSVERMVTG